MASDDDGTRAGREVGHNLVRAEETLLVVCGSELLSKVVGADGTEVPSGSIGHHVLAAIVIASAQRLPSTEQGKTDLGSTGSVLGGTTSDVGDLVVLLDVGVAERTCAGACGKDFETR